MSCYIELTELPFIDGLPRKLVLDIAAARAVKPWAVGTLVVGSKGFVHVQESVHQVRQLILHAQECRFATLADLAPDPSEELFRKSTLPGPVYSRNTIRSRREHLTLNEVDLVGLIEQQDRMQDEVRADALGE